MQSQNLTTVTQKPLSVLRKGQRGAPQLRFDQQRIFLPQHSSLKRTQSHRYTLNIRVASELRGMAQSVLSKPHRFILVSDLDWTMVRMTSFNTALRAHTV